MPEFMMIMKGPGGKGDWESYIKGLQKTGMFLGGSILGNGQCVSKNKTIGSSTVTGYMRFKADHIDHVKSLVSGNPDYESGGEIEILEVIFG